MSSDIAISVSGLSKCFKIYDKPIDRFKQILVRGKSKYYKDFWALKDICFKLRRGETLGIIGQNGSGKSTLLQLICGTLNPTSGKIQNNGRIAALLELGSGFNPEFTGVENIYLNGAILGLDIKEINSRLDDILNFADIGDFAEKPVKLYSSGMMMRLAFSVQASINPDILIVDEALSVGDELFQRKCFARLEELRNSGTSILFVSHSAESVIQLCDRCLLLNQGEQLMLDSPKKTIAAYQRLIYSPAELKKNFIEELKKLNSSSSLLKNDPIGEPNEFLKEVANVDFDTNLIPKSKKIYPLNGAEIEHIAILDDDEECINTLNPRQHCTFIMTGKFLKSFSGVYFGIHISTVSGVVITGQRYPSEGRYVKNIKQGLSFKVKFSFNVDLLSGVYFVGGGLWTDYQDCAHRILDAIAFRVKPQESPISFGYVDMSSTKEKPDLELF